jgi:hypothetical protein
MSIEIPIELGFALTFESTVNDLNRLLKMTLVPSGSYAASPISKTLQGIVNHHNTGNMELRDFQLHKLRYLVRDLKRLEAFLASRDVPIILGESPDFTIENSDVALECTSARLRKSGRVDIAAKVRMVALDPNHVAYATSSMVLLMDVTNLLFNEPKPLALKPYRSAARDALSRSPFGAIILSALLLVPGKGMGMPCVREDSTEIAPDLLKFLDAHYPMATTAITEFSVPFEAT